MWGLAKGVPQCVCLKSQGTRSHHVLPQSITPISIFSPQIVDCHWISCVDSLSDHVKDLCVSLWRRRASGRTDSPSYRSSELPRRSQCILPSCSILERLTAFYQAATAKGRLGSRPPPTSCVPSSSEPAGSLRRRTSRIDVSFAFVPAASRCMSPRAACVRTRRRSSSA